MSFGEGKGPGYLAGRSSGRVNVLQWNLGTGEVSVGQWVEQDRRGHGLSRWGSSRARDLESPTVVETMGSQVLISLTQCPGSQIIQAGHTRSPDPRVWESILHLRITNNKSQQAHILISMAIAQEASEAAQEGVKT